MICFPLQQGLILVSHRLRVRAGAALPLEPRTSPARIATGRSETLAWDGGEGWVARTAGDAPRHHALLTMKATGSTSEVRTFPLGAAFRSEAGAMLAKVAAMPGHEAFTMAVHATGAAA